MKCAVLLLLVQVLYSCRPRYNPKTGGIVCLCDEKYCDSIDNEFQGIDEAAIAFTSDKTSQRLNRTSVQWSTDLHFRGPPIPNLYVVDIDSKKQEILGFGVGFTDSASSLAINMTKGLRKLLLHQYFGDNSIHITFGRTPMSSADFSQSNYTYDDVVDDFNLTHWKINDADIKYKMPIMRQVHEIIAASSNPEYRLRMIGSSWSPPGWMKTSGSNMAGGLIKGPINGPYYKVYAKYLTRYVKAYKDAGLPFWAVTVQNQPGTGFLPGNFITMGWLPDSIIPFIRDCLLPEFTANGLADLKLLNFDGMRFGIDFWPDAVLADPVVNGATYGIAVHFYFDSQVPPSLLDHAHKHHPDKVIINTEAATGSVFDGLVGPSFGNWTRAELYAYSMIEDFNHHVNAWSEWNFLLDHEGGPNLYPDHKIAAIITVNHTDPTYLIKEATFYALAHFSAYLLPGSTVLGYEVNQAEPLNSILVVQRPDNLYVAVLSNRLDTPFTMHLRIPERPGLHLPLVVSPRSLMTILFK